MARELSDLDVDPDPSPEDRHRLLLTEVKQQWISVSDAARVIGVSDDTMRRRVEKLRLKNPRICKGGSGRGNKILIDVNELRRHVVNIDYDRRRATTAEVEEFREVVRDLDAKLTAALDLIASLQRQVGRHELALSQRASGPQTDRK